MITLVTYSRELPIGFDEFSKQFSKELHYKLTGWNKFMQLTSYFRILERNNDLIRLIDNGKDLDYIDYYRGINNKTFVRCSAKISAVYIIIAIILLVFIVGFLIVPIQLISNVLAAKSKVNKIAINSIKVLPTKTVDIQENSKPTSATIENDLVENRQNLVDNKFQSPESNLPPPIKPKISSTPPPIPITSTLTEQNAVPPPLPKPSFELRFYIALNGKQLGPYDTEKLKLLIEVGQLTRETLVWKKDMPEWDKANNIKELNELFN